LRDRRMLHKNGTIIEVESNVKLIPMEDCSPSQGYNRKEKSGPANSKGKTDSETIIDSLPGIS